MDNTDIEKMWKEGFQHQKVNISQKQINDIMKAKSTNLVGKIKSTAKIDHYSGLVVFPAIVAAIFYFGYYWIGVVVGLALGALLIQNTLMLRKLNKIIFKDSTLNYLVEFRAFIKFMKRYYTRLLIFGGWIITAPSFLFGYDLGGIPLKELFSSENMVLSLGLVLFFFIISALIAVGAYRLVTKLMYGRKLKKIDDIIAELSREEV